MVKEGETDTPEFEQRTKLDHSTHNAEVGGSSPPVATSLIKHLIQHWLDLVAPQIDTRKLDYAHTNWWLLKFWSRQVRES